MIPHSSFLLYLFLSPSLTTDSLLPTFPLSSHAPCYLPIPTLPVFFTFMQRSLFIFLVSAAIPGYILTSEHLVLGPSDEKE